jgi:hypothetical protein
MAVLAGTDFFTVEYLYHTTTNGGVSASRAGSKSTRVSAGLSEDQRVPLAQKMLFSLTLATSETMSFTLVTPLRSQFLPVPRPETS